ncbi:MAG: polysaccharide biosynthesis tyrosine autokinase [Oceanipulchritudo sp.]
MSNNSNQPGSGGSYYGGYYYGEGYGAGYGDDGNGPSRSLGDYLLILRERIWWLVVAVFVVFLGFALYTFNAPKVYRAAASVEILRQKDRVFQTEDVVRQEVVNAEDFNTQIKILESLNIVQAVDERLKGSLRTRFLEPYEEGLDATLRGSKSVAQILYANRNVSPARLSLVVNILYDHPDPEIAATVANYFAEEFIDFNRNEQIEGSLRAVDDLRAQADQQLVKIKEMEMQLADFKEKHDTLSVERSQDIDTQQMISLNARLDEDKQKYDETRILMEQIESAREAGEPLWELSFLSSSGQVQELLNKLTLNKIEIASLSKKFRQKHPTMIAATEQLEQTKNQLQLAVNSAASSIRNEYERSKSNFENSQRRLAEKQEQLIQIDRIRPDYNALVRDLEVSQQLYNHYYNRLQQASVQVTSEGQVARIIDRAVAPVRPFKPNITLNLAIGLVLGLGVGLGLVFLLAMLDDKVKSAFDIESTLGVPLIGIVPHIFSIDAQEKARIAADGHDKHAVEAFRSIHSTLKLGEESRNAKVILSTSTIPSEGKTFVSTNSAITFAGHGERTIVVDADLRMPNVAKGLEIDGKRGVIQYITDEADLDSLIHKNYVENLDILPSGGSTRSPTQILSSDRFADLIHELRLRYDRILIDTPPIATVSDALNILPLVDGFLLVIRFNMVKRKTAAVNLKRLRDSNVPIFGAILNNLNTHVAGYYYSHYYDKSYKSYKQYYLRGNNGVPSREEVVVGAGPGPGKKPSEDMKT